ncbi:hypothetical protein [Thalassovita sp.]|uniref:hypothetical protein n=1 Tax=Thalassovita sp. TaxID=1979401 RepID=UPI0029DE8770|nr:hypothetical protein [Thalassovita sp.]
MNKAALLTAIAALGFASAAVAQDIADTPNVMTRNVPAESVQGPNDSGTYLFDFATVSFGEQTVAEIDGTQFPRAAAASATGLMTSYAFDSAGDTGNNDFSPR